jgi:hypothetical protein
VTAHDLAADRRGRGRRDPKLSVAHLAGDVAAIGYPVRRSAIGQITRLWRRRR